jgi:tRNA(Arg) A34 adenosine deaminase TadA
MKLTTSKTIVLPEWILKETQCQTIKKTDFEKTDFVLDLVLKNIEHGTGGPFAAAIFDKETHELISVGVNVVVEQNCSPAHAEIVAIIMAQEKLNKFRLDNGNYLLVSSAQPCAMCTGAIVWSGVKTLIYCATKEDVESIVGFDEGPVHPDWIIEYKKRGIEVFGMVNHEKSREVLKLYKNKKGIVY